MAPFWCSDFEKKRFGFGYLKKKKKTTIIIPSAATGL